MATPLFHLAFPVHDLAAARAFYSGVLGCREGRSSAAWVDFDFFGHQLVAHLQTASALAAAPMAGGGGARGTNAVDGDDVPVAHFGVILAWDEWERWGARLRAAGVRFEIEPHVRFAGRAGEQGTMFFRDPSGNALEFKAFRDARQVFAPEPR